MVSFLENFGEQSPPLSSSAPAMSVSVGNVRVTAAREAADHGMSISMERAERDDAMFAAKARAAILNHLAAVKEATGEDLTDIAQAHGAKCADARAFGAVFQGLARHGLIKKVGYAPRRRGHCAPGPVWRLGEA